MSEYQWIACETVIWILVHSLVLSITSFHFLRDVLKFQNRDDKDFDVLVYDGV